MNCETLNAVLLDDGTLDYVVRCKDCGWTERYNAESEVAEALTDGDEERAWTAADEDHYADQEATA